MRLGSFLGPPPLGWISTKGQPSREAMPLANVVLPVPGGPKRTMAQRWGDRVPGGELRLLERKNDPALDDLLGVLEALQLAPETGLIFRPQTAARSVGTEVAAVTGRSR